MELFFRIILAAAGIVNLLPSMLFFSPEKIPGSYGVDVSGPDMELLLRHRAILFGIIGVLMLYAAICRKKYSLATLSGLVSMTSFVMLFYLIGNINSQLTTVMRIDAAVSIILLITYAGYRVRTHNQ